MIKIELRYTEAESDCDLCGPDWVGGLEVFVDGVLVAGEPANAGCCSKSRYPSILEVLHGVMSALHSEYAIEEVHKND